MKLYTYHCKLFCFITTVASPDTSVSVFSWQVKSYGQGQPSTFIGVFDINRWYHAQMPDSLRYEYFWGNNIRDKMSIQSFIQTILHKCSCSECQHCIANGSSIACCHGNTDRLTACRNVVNCSFSIMNWCQIGNVLCHEQACKDSPNSGCLFFFPHIFEKCQFCQPKKQNLFSSS